MSVNKESSDAVWKLKEIIYPPGSGTVFKTVSQNRNGPCSLIAICNILILRGDIQILPYGRTSASYEYLASLVADYIVNRREGLVDADLSAALAILPSTQYGMDLNPLFTGISSFRPAGDGGQLKLFELCNIQLVHGWLADPASSEFSILQKAEDYDTALNMIVAGEETHMSPETLPQEIHTANSSDVAVMSGSDVGLRDALILRQFFDSNSTQLTYHGLFSLFSLEEGLYAFIRNSHLSVLRKHIDPSSGAASLYTLVTDSNFASEPAVIWETLEDIDGAGSRFLDANLNPASTAGGDYAGRTAESALRDAEIVADSSTINADYVLAKQLQDEEDAITHRAEQPHISDPQQIYSPPPGPAIHQTPPATRPVLDQNLLPKHSIAPSIRTEEKKKKDCIIQ